MRRKLPRYHKKRVRHAVNQRNFEKFLKEFEGKKNEVISASSKSVRGNER